MQPAGGSNLYLYISSAYLVGEQPAAITDVQYEDRPDYIRTEDQTIQKAYGQR